MQAIMISTHAKWCAKIMNGEKKVEVRKNKALANAIQKLIDKYGYAEIYVYCTKDTKEYLVWGTDLIDDSIVYGTEINASGERNGNGKVVFKFRCYKVEEIKFYNYDNIYETDKLTDEELRTKSCLSWFELNDYLKGKNGYAIHVSDLEIFDEPKELSEFKTYKTYNLGDLHNCHVSLTKAPQNFCYVEVDDVK